MHILIPLLSFLFLAVTVNAAILVQTPNGSYAVKESIAEANTAADAAGRTVIITSPQKLTVNTILASDRSWRIERGGLIDHGQYSLTIPYPDAGLYQIFAGNGSVTIIAAPEVYPEWFGDITKDAATSINAAIASIDAGRVRLSATTYSASTVYIKSKIHLVGSGKNATILKSNSKTRDAMIKTFDFDVLSGTNSLSGQYSFSIENMTLDGNSKGGSNVDGIKLYGYSFKLHDLVVKNCAGTGIVAEWTTLPNSPIIDLDFAESTVSDVSVHNNANNGILWGGPHDSVWTNVISYRNGGKYNIKVHKGAGPLYATNCHSWGNGVDYAWFLDKRAQLVNCVGEGAQVAQVYMAGSNTSIIGGEFFGAGSLDSKGLIFAGNVAGMDIFTNVRDCLAGAIDFGSGPKSSKIVVNNYQKSGMPRVGTIPTDGLVIFNSTGVSGYNVNRFNSIPQALHTNGKLIVLGN